MVRKEEFEDLLTNIKSGPLKLALEMIFYDGFRPHELLSIRVSDVEIIATEMIINLPRYNPKVASKKNKTGRREIIIL